MSNLLFQGTIKVPKPQGRAFIQPLIKDASGEWVAAGDEREETNLVLDQAMAVLYGSWYDLGSGNDPHPQYQSHIVFGAEQYRSVFYNVMVSDNTDPADATNTTKKGTCLNLTNIVRTVEDAGDVGGTDYTRTIVEGIYFDDDRDNYTIAKLYGVCAQYLDDYDPNLTTYAPVTELLLNQPIHISNGAQQAVKIRYEVLWPRIGDYSQQGLVTCGTGTIAIQERDINDVVTTGPNVNWTMKFAGHRFGNASGAVPDPAYNEVTTPCIQTVPGTPGPTKTSSTVGANLTGYCYRDSASCTVSNPTAKSVQYDFEQVLSRTGAVGSSRDVAGIMMLWTEGTSDWGDSNKGGSPWWVEFDAPIEVDWTETLEIHATLTIDWS